MKTQQDLHEEYRNQLRQCARNLAVGRTDVVAGFLPGPELAEMVDVFVEGNLDKRIWKLNDQFESVKDHFEELDDWFKEYIRTVPLVAYDNGASDSVIFLDWVERTMTLSPEQQDLATCHRSRIAVEEKARGNRMGHVRFQEMLTMTERLMREFETNPKLWIHLNPIRIWAKFDTAVLVDDEEDLPATVIFYPVESDIRTAVLESLGQIVVDELEMLSSCRLAELLDAFPETEHEAVVDICRDLAEMGLVALG